MARKLKQTWMFSNHQPLVVLLLFPLQQRFQPVALFITYTNGFITLIYGGVIAIPPKLYPIFDKPHRPIPTATSEVIEIVDGMPIAEARIPAPSEGGSCYNPIVLGTSPVRPNHHPKGKPKTHTRPKETNTTASFPTNESQHIRGPQSSFSSPALIFSRRAGTRPVRSEDPSPEGALHRFLPSDDMECLQRCCVSRTTCSRDCYVDTIPEDHRSHAAVARLLEYMPSPNAPPIQKVWTDKWRPTSAEQILGNEKQAIYLRDWLRALELQLESDAPPTASVKGKVGGTKRPRILRAVEKKRKKVRAGSDDDWIVYSSEEEYSSSESEFDRSLDDDAEWVETSRRHLTQGTNENEVGTSPSNDFKGMLTNTILLTGPHGSGKTAAVYACAKELDWEVFEVDPGIGKRNSSSLENMIGEVGKNHLVRQTGHGTEIFGFVTTADVKTCSESSRGVRQSMVLLEEVDILYKEDTHFWPTVIKIIKDCKRPVIMTCTTVDLIPMDDLPLQTKLVFEACPVPLGVSYLQGVCFAEDYLMKREDLFGIYEGLDLRRAMNQVHFISFKTGWDMKGEESSEEGMMDWESKKDGWEMMIQESNLISYMDSKVSVYVF